MKGVPGTDDVFVYPNTYLDGSVNQTCMAGSDGCHGLLVTKITMRCDRVRDVFVDNFTGKWWMGWFAKT